MSTRDEFLNAVSVTQGPQHHFFGYYDKSCWNAAGRRIVGLETAFMDHPPTEDDCATIGLIDTTTPVKWTPLAQTKAWNWQQGCMLQWLGSSESIIFNDREGDRFVSRILDVETGRERTLERPVYAVSPQGTHAISLSFSRLQHQRPGYGYPGVADPYKDVPEPTDDGLYHLDLETGASRLILSVAEVAAFERCPEFDGKMHRFNHAQFNTDGSRFAFLHRYKSPDEEVGHTRLMTANPDGSDLRCLAHSELVSHYDWRDPHTIIVWTRRPGEKPAYVLYSDGGGQAEAIGTDLFNTDGHCSFSPDGRWVLTDTYPDKEDMRTLILYDWQNNLRVNIGRFYAPPMEWQIRCDLHPRWSRDGRQVCIDSIHEGSRQMYVLDVSSVTQPIQTLA
ncbi:MAG: hypothetical protein ACQKBW_07175 [Puniceicoccales bacterium]